MCHCPLWGPCPTCPGGHDLVVLQFHQAAVVLEVLLHGVLELVHGEDIVLQLHESSV